MKPKLDRKISAVIFDMDGVIVDSEPVHERSFREIFAELGCSETHGIHFPDYFGKSDRTVWIDFLKKNTPTFSLDELVAWKQKRSLEILRDTQPIYESIPLLVSDLAARYKLALASGSAHPVIDEVLAMRGLRLFFSAVVSSQDVKHGKPAPDIFLRAAELIETKPEECCVIEDSAAGVSGAKSAGMFVIGITNSLPAEKLSHANAVVSNYKEIEEILGMREKG